MYISCLLDELIVGSSNREDRARDLRRLFQRLKETGLLLNRVKCQLVATGASLTFLGDVVDSQGIAIHPERLGATIRFSVLTTLKELAPSLKYVHFPIALCRMLVSLSRLKSVNHQKNFEE